ncbi:hypothetical protein CEP54_000395 [Fusarium duplospermum]|uniref:Uncharacterized protein n=1 Tax=Fusarium duplospermum TaxID=1325734 RepID=A0A428R751_9HYPO|nr:hypothetical protein CEP54_000395 [Fusarium duplospermum]
MERRYFNNAKQQRDRPKRNHISGTGNRTLGSADKDLSTELMRARNVSHYTIPDIGLLRIRAAIGNSESCSASLRRCEQVINPSIPPSEAPLIRFAGVGASSGRGRIMMSGTLARLHSHSESINLTTTECFVNSKPKSTSSLQFEP